MRQQKKKGGESKRKRDKETEERDVKGVEGEPDRKREKRSRLANLLFSLSGALL